MRPIAMIDTPANAGLGKQPALILLYGSGNAVQRTRILDRDAIILGRSRGCDFVLEAPDVSSPHCVITRNSTGYSVRDCGSRAGTRHNGESIQFAQLLDGDILQVGPFSFRLALPQAARESRLASLERKRRHLAQLCLAQRRRLQQMQRQSSKAADAEADLAQKAEALAEQIRQYEQRFFRLEQAERDLSRDRELFEQVQQAFDTQMEQSEIEQTQRTAAEFAAGPRVS